MTRSRLAFYVDSDAIGGHEIMAARLIAVAAGQPDVETQILYHHPFFERVAQRCARAAVIPRPSPTHAALLRDLRPGEVLALRRTLRDWSPDALIVVQGFIEGSIRGVLAGRAAGIRTLSYIAQANSASKMGARFGAVRDVIDRALYRLPAAFITVSPEQASTLRRRTSVPIRVLTNTFAPILEEEQAGTQLRLDREQFNVAVVGRIRFSDKNQAALIPVASRLRDAGSRVCIHVIGDGPDRAELEQFIRLHRLEGQLRIHGAVPPPEIRRLLSDGIDLLLMVSHYEAMPLVVLEAVAAGRRVIVPPLGFAAELGIPVSDQVAPGDSARIAALLEEAARTGQNASPAPLRKHVLDTFSAERFTTAVATLVSQDLWL